MATSLTLSMLTGIWFGWVHDFAVFNVADVAINLGIVCYVLEVILAKKPEYLEGQAMTKEALKEQAVQD